jgi:hypothetical protein
VCNEVADSPRKIVLFIDDIHNLVPNAAQQVSFRCQARWPRQQSKEVAELLVEFEPCLPGLLLGGGHGAPMFYGLAIPKTAPPGTLVPTWGACIAYSACWYVLFTQGASMFDGSAILKPALARGQLRCLGCSSPDKFKKTIEKDPGLERRFQLVSGVARGGGGPKGGWVGGVPACTASVIVTGDAMARHPRGEVGLRKGGSWAAAVLANLRQCACWLLMVVVAGVVCCRCPLTLQTLRPSPQFCVGCGPDMSTTTA